MDYFSKEFVKIKLEKLEKESNIVKDRCSKLEEIILNQGQIIRALTVLVLVLTGMVIYLYTFQ